MMTDRVTADRCAGDGSGRAHPPTGLDDLIGATTVTVETADHEYRLSGVG